MPTGTADGAVQDFGADPRRLTFAMGVFPRVWHGYPRRRGFASWEIGGPISAKDVAKVRGDRNGACDRRPSRVGTS